MLVFLIFTKMVIVGIEALKIHKFAAIILTICLLSLNYSFSQEQVQSKFLELENGLKVFLFERHTIPLINIAFAANLGTKDESDETSGLVHILEHYILFRGTELRSGDEISQDIRRHGAYFNAHTGRDLAVFELSLPSEYADFALRNQKEILFNIKFSQEELDKEKKVILEELSQIQDDPRKYAISLVLQNLFKNHPYQKPIYGKQEIIEAATVDQIEKFYKKYFAPSNCSLAVVGDFNMEEMEKKVEEIFGDLKNEGFTPSDYKKVDPLEKTVEIEQEMDVNQAYLVIGATGPDYNNPNQYAMHILTEIFSRGVNPTLHSRLRGKRLLADTISMSYGAYKFGGTLLIFLTLDPKKIKSAKRETIKFLKQSKNQNYSIDDHYGDSKFYAFDFLQSAINQIKFRTHQAQEKGLLLAASIARFMLLNEDPNRGSYLDSIDKVKSTELRKIASKYFSKNRYVIVTIIPKKKNN